MNYSVNPSSELQKSFKRLFRKHKSLEKDVDILVESLSKNPHQGILIKENTYKIRLAISSKGRGKSGVQGL